MSYFIWIFLWTWMNDILIFMTFKGKNNFLFVRIKNAQPKSWGVIQFDTDFVGLDRG